MILPKLFFSKRQNKAEFKDQDDSEVLSSEFPGLRTSAASMASTSSVASMTFTVSFNQIGNKYWSFSWNGLSKSKLSLIAVPFLSEAVEVSQYY